MGPADSGAFGNPVTVVEATGSGLDQAVRVGIYLRGFADFAEMNEIYAQYVKGPELPVRTTLPVPLVGFDIEIDAILYTGG